MSAVGILPPVWNRSSRPSRRNRRSSLISPSEANRFGLERTWFTRVQFDRARGRIGHVRQHVSSKYGYTVHEVISERGRTVITDRDLDRLGAPLGKEGAEKLANRLVLQYKRSGIEAEIKTRKCFLRSRSMLCPIPAPCKRSTARPGAHAGQLIVGNAALPDRCAGSER